MSKGHWYCENCDSSIAPVSVTYDELHSQCGHKVKWIESTDELLRTLLSKLGQDKHYGFYQLCPKCDGEKIIPGTHYDNGTVLVDRTCPLCKGEGKLVRPEIKTT